MEWKYRDYVQYCGFENLPEGLDTIFLSYRAGEPDFLIERCFLSHVYDRFQLPEENRRLFTKAVEAVEADRRLFEFTKFLVWDMCSARNRCDVDNYTNLTPKCMPEFAEYYSFLLLLACVVPSVGKMEERGIPKHDYEEIPYTPMKHQFEKYVKTGSVQVSDFPWDMNFYTCAIFLLDRFYFIPCRFEDSFTMYRNKKSGKVVALRHGGEEFRRDGQVNGINKVFDEAGKFVSVWQETADEIRANRINPMGYVEKTPITIQKDEWAVALEYGDIMLGFHIPSGPGYTPERVGNSMRLALNFFAKYFPEIPVKGFWSESWLYDTHLSLILKKDSNIVRVQDQFFKYPINEGDGMLRYEVFGDWKADPAAAEPKTTLQKKAAAYMAAGGRFNTLSMVVLSGEADRMGEAPYLTEEDREGFQQTVDSHLK